MLYIQKYLLEYKNAGAFSTDQIEEQTKRFLYAKTAATVIALATAAAECFLCFNLCTVKELKKSFCYFEKQ